MRREGARVRCPALLVLVTRAPPSKRARLQAPYFPTRVRVRASAVVRPGPAVRTRRAGACMGGWARDHLSRGSARAPASQVREAWLLQPTISLTQPITPPTRAAAAS